MILWGPPGTGKTTLAHILANHADAQWISMSAVLAGVRDVRNAVNQAQENPSLKTVVFLDEVHRFNKAQQDALLPHVENGTITLIGATTENPSFEVISALLSRTRVYVLNSLDRSEIQEIIRNAINKEFAELSVSDEAMLFLCESSEGDARRALNVLEVAEQLATNNFLGMVEVSQAFGIRIGKFDKGGEEYYNQISALHKSMRGSNPDAALYWFTRMIEGGCDPHYIARRLVRFASEDIGTADVRALSIALDAWDGFHRLGSPEGELCLAEAVIYLSSVPKSNAVYAALNKTSEFVRNNPSLPVPLKLRNAPTSLLKSLDYGKNYRYVHEEQEAYASGESYFPDEMEPQEFYHPSDRGLEARIRERLERLRRLDQVARKT